MGSKIIGRNDSWEPEDEDAALEAAPTLPLLSRDRVAAILEKHGWSFDTDEDGDLFATWEEIPFWFNSHGEQNEIFQVQCQYPWTVDPDQLLNLQSVLDDWNSDETWPRVYFDTHPRTGKLGVFGDVVVDYQVGVTDDQLELHLQCAVDASMKLCRLLSKLTD